MIFTVPWVIQRRGCPCVPAKPKTTSEIKLSVPSPKHPLFILLRTESMCVTRLSGVGQGAVMRRLLIEGGDGVQGSPQTQRPQLRRRQREVAHLCGWQVTSGQFSKLAQDQAPQSHLRASRVLFVTHHLGLGHGQAHTSRAADLCHLVLFAVSKKY